MTMDLTIQSMTPIEQYYCYSQSQQLSMQTGLIGYLRRIWEAPARAFTARGTTSGLS